MRTWISNIWDFSTRAMTPNCRLHETQEQGSQSQSCSTTVQNWSEVVQHQSMLSGMACLMILQHDGCVYRASPLTAEG